MRLIGALPEDVGVIVTKIVLPFGLEMRKSYTSELFPRPMWPKVVCLLSGDRFIFHQRRGPRSAI